MKRHLALLLLVLWAAGSAEAASPSRWRVRDGWLQRSRDGGAHYEPFFVLALWGAPGWQGSADGDPAVQAKLIEAARHFNVIHTRGVDLPDIDRYLPDSLRDTVFMVGLATFNDRFLDPAKGRRYSGPVPLRFVASSGRPDYASVRALEAALAVGGMDDYMDGIAQSVQRGVDQTWADGRGLDTLWNLADEPDANYDGWLWPPALIAAYRRAVGRIAPGAVTFMGISAVTGNLYCFERLLTADGRRPLPPALPRTPAELPASFPADAVRDWQGDPDHYASYLFMADGTPARLDAGTRYNAWTLLRPRMEATVRVTAEGYADCADAFGLNRYGAFQRYPALAGECVDAIRSACGATAPIWLFFDGLGRDDDLDYWANLRCQVYTSLVHGASGVQFWQPGSADRNPSDFWWQRVKGLADELRALAPLLAGTVEGRQVTAEGAHLVILADRAGVRTLVATNPNFKTRCDLDLPGVYQGSLAPLGVLVHVGLGPSSLAGGPR